MRALTIQQPYSHLICHHHSELPEGAIQKRVENRTRPTKIRGHDHAVGPYMYVLDNVCRLETPVPCAGKQGWWTVPEEIERQVNECRKIAVPFDICAERFTGK